MSDANLPDPSGLPDLPADAYYERLDDTTYRSTDATQSPWDFASQHGGPPSALLGRCIEEHVGAEPLAIGKIDVDFLGPIPQGVCEITVDTTRPGRRVRQVQATMAFDGRVAAAARAWLVSYEEDRAPVSGEPFVPPAVPGPQTQAYFPGLDPSWGYGRSVEWRYVTGAFTERDAASVDLVTRLWGRVRIPLVSGEKPSDLQRLLVLADSANGVSAPLPLKEWLFIPPGVGITVQRPPATDWMFLEAMSHSVAHGMGVAHATVADEDGLCGYVTQPLLVAPR